MEGLYATNSVYKPVKIIGPEWTIMVLKITVCYIINF